MIDLVLADPVTLVALGATAIGGGITAFGKYQQGQAAATMYGAEADVAGKTAAAEKQAAEVTDYAGYRAAESTGLQARAGVGRQAVEYAAGNIGGGTPGAVRASQVALGVQGERETLAKYRETGYQERLRGAEGTAAAGRYTAAAAEAPIAGDIEAAGAGISTVGRVASMAGSAQQVSSKWYGASDEAIY